MARTKEDVLQDAKELFQNAITEVRTSLKAADGHPVRNLTELEMGKLKLNQQVTQLQDLESEIQSLIDEYKSLQ